MRVVEKVIMLEKKSEQAIKRCMLLRKLNKHKEITGMTIVLFPSISAFIYSIRERRDSDGRDYILNAPWNNVFCCLFFFFPKLRSICYCGKKNNLHAIQELITRITVLKGKKLEWK